MDSELQNYRNMLLKRKQMADIYKAELKKTYDKSSIVTSDGFDDKKPKLLVEDETENPRYKELTKLYEERPAQQPGELDEYYNIRYSDWFDNYEQKREELQRLTFNDEKNKLLNNLRKIMSNNDATYILSKLDATPDNLLLLNKYWGKFEKKLRDSFTSLDKNTLLGFIDSFLENIDNELSGKSFKMIEGISDKIDKLTNRQEERLNKLTFQIGQLKDIANKYNNNDVANKLGFLTFTITKTKEAVDNIKNNIKLSLEEKATAQTELMKQLNSEIITAINNSEIKRDTQAKNIIDDIKAQITTTEQNIFSKITESEQNIKREIDKLDKSINKIDASLKNNNDKLETLILKNTNLDKTLKDELLKITNSIRDIDFKHGATEDYLELISGELEFLSKSVSSAYSTFEYMSESIMNETQKNRINANQQQEFFKILEKINNDINELKSDISKKQEMTDMLISQTLGTINEDDIIDSIVERGKRLVEDQPVEPEEEPTSSTSSRKPNEGNVDDLLKLDIPTTIGKIITDKPLLNEINKTIKRNIGLVKSIAGQYINNLEGLEKEGFNEKITQLLNRLNRGNAKLMDVDELRLILELIKYYRKVKADEGILEKYRTYKKITKTEKNRFYEETSKPVFGLGSKRRVYGKGLSIDEKSTYPKENEFYRLFGRYLVDMDKLNNNILKVYHHTSFNNVKYIKNSTISDEFVNLIMFILDKKKFNDKIFNSLEAEEQELFKILFTKSGLSKMMNVKDIDNTTKQAKQDYKNMIERYNILQGEINGGNNSPKVYNELNTLISDLKKQITYLVKLNSMPKGEAQLKILSL